MNQLTMNISGMTCGHCVGAVTQALKELDGVQVQQVNIGSAAVLYDVTRTTPEKLTEAIEDAGYQVESTEIGASRVGP